MSDYSKTYITLNGDVRHIREFILVIVRKEHVMTGTFTHMSSLRAIRRVLDHTLVVNGARYACH